MAEQHEKALVPQIRFTGFTDPWEQRELVDIAEIVGGGTPDTNNSNYWDGDIDWYAPAELGNNIYAESSTRKITQAGFDSCSTKMLPADKTILFTSRAGIGNTAILRHSACTNQGFQSLVIGDADVYFVYSMSERIKKWAEEKASGSTFLEISGRQLETMPVNLPSLVEQQAIGSFFSHLDDLITLHQRKYDKLVILKKSMLEKMFPKDGESVPEIRFAGFTDPWEQRKFSEIVDVCSGRDYKHLDEGPIPVYGTGGYMTSVSEALSHNRDAIGIGRKGTIDKPYLLKAPFWTVDTLFYAIPKSDINLEFALCSFLNVDWKSKDESTGLPSLSKESINETVLSVPNVVEQNHLGNFFADLDRLITLHQRKLELLQNIKKSLLDKMFV